MLFAQGTHKSIGSNKTFITLMADLRNYTQLSREYTFAQRIIFLKSMGHEPEYYTVYGPFFYHGSGWETLEGNNIPIMNFEFRYPQFKRLDLGWPLPITLGTLYGNSFIDLAAGWTDQDGFDPFTQDEYGNDRLKDLHMSYGFGLRLNIAYMILRFDWSWKTDLISTNGPYFIFSIGPDF
jgi:outer membrane protein assembly factor BamA